MLLMFSRGFKDIITKTAKFKEFPGLENKFQNSRGFKEIKDTWEPCIYICRTVLVFDNLKIVIFGFLVIGKKMYLYLAKCI